MTALRPLRPLTKQAVDRLELPAKGKREDYGDAEVRGYFVRVHADGRKVACIRYRIGGRQLRFTIGPIGGKFTAHEAREEARRRLADVRKGGDPSGDKRAQRAACTFEQAADRFLAEHVDSKRKARTAASYRTLLRLHIVPALGSLKIADVTRPDVERMHSAIGKRVGKGAANRALAVVSAICTWAERHELRPQRSNPCRGVERFKERKLGHYLDAAEVARLDAALQAAASTPRGAPGYVAPGSVVAVRLLLLTGCRLGEMVTLTWSMVDTRHGVLRLPESKTGARIVPLAPQAIAVLDHQRAQADDRGAARPGDLVCTGETGGPVHNIQRAWRSIREQANLPTVRLHDLRHSAASSAIESGVPIELVGAMLGHRSVLTTARYRHIADAALRSAAASMGDMIERKTRDGAAVISLPVERAAKGAKGKAAGGKRRERAGA